MESTQLTKATGSYTLDEWNMLKEQARAACASGFLPRHIQKPEQAVIIAMKGRELGIPFMQAMASITVIQGKPALSAELMLALIYKNCPGAEINFLTPSDKSHEEATVEMRRPHGKPQRFTFTLADARRAGLLSNPSWTKYPSAMLRARVVSAAARAVFPDAIMGCYTPEELGEVVDTEPSHHEQMPPPEPPEKLMGPPLARQSRIEARFLKNVEKKADT